MSRDVTSGISVLLYVDRPCDELGDLIGVVREGLADRDLNEIIILDDGTSSVSDPASLGDGNIPIKVVRFGKLFGESVAVDAGLDVSVSDQIITLPAARPVGVEDIVSLVAGLDEGADLMVGYRDWRMTGLFDRLQVKVFYSLTRRASGTSFRDLSSGVRAFRREVCQEISLYGDMIRFLPVLAVGRGYLVKEFSIEKRPSSATSTKGGITPRDMATPAVYLNRVLDVLTLFFLLRFTRKPLRFFGALGASLLVPGLLIDLYLFLSRIAFGQAIAGRPLVLLGILLTVLGVQTISIGLIGEMIIFSHSREIRDYSIREILE